MISMKTTGISAGSGNIGPFSVNDGALYAGTGVSTVGLGIDGTNYAFWAGGDDSFTAPVRIGHDGGIVCTTLTQTSLEESKKNFEKLENGLDIVLGTEIYKYNLKNEDDSQKKHIGFVIGADRNYKEEITSKDNDGVDLYSMISASYKAIQEQQKQIEELKEEIKRLKGE